MSFESPMNISTRKSEADPDRRDPLVDLPADRLAPYPFHDRERRMRPPSSRSSGRKIQEREGEADQAKHREVPRERLTRPCRDMLLCGWGRRLPPPSLTIRGKNVIVAFSVPPVVAEAAAYRPARL